MNADKLRDKLTKLFRLFGSTNLNEREAARRKIDELLARNRKSWNDLCELISTGKTQGWQNDDEPAGPVGRFRIRLHWTLSVAFWSNTCI
jgi:hypothetical protein